MTENNDNQILTVAELFFLQKSTESEINLIEKRIFQAKQEHSALIKELRKTQKHKKHHLSALKEKSNCAARIFFETNEKVEISNNDYGHKILSKEELKNRYLSEQPLMQQFDNGYDYSKNPGH